MNKKYLEFNEDVGKGKTKIFVVVNKEEGYLGNIKWRSGWRKYTFFPIEDTVFDSICLREIATFLNKLNKKHKERNK